MYIPVSINLISVDNISQTYFFESGFSSLQDGWHSSSLESAPFFLANPNLQYMDTAI